MLVDVQTGRLRWATALDEHAGWHEDRHLIRWHPDGRRLAINSNLNGILVLRDGRIVGRAFPDEGRDSGVHYIWLGDQIFADTGARFEVRDGDDLFPPHDVAQSVENIEWNAAIGAAVGDFGTHGMLNGITAYDPSRKKVVYRVADVYKSGHPRWSDDGRWFAVGWSEVVGTRPDGYLKRDGKIRICSGDDGRMRATYTSSLPNIDSLSWGHDGMLAVVCSGSAKQHVEILHKWTLVQRIDLGSRHVAPWTRLADTDRVAWSPSGDHFALLLDHDEVQIRDAKTGAVLATFSAPSPAAPDLPYLDAPSGSLLWVTPQRLVRVANYFVSIWSVDGKKVGELVVPR
jgi:hypothetical protein